MQLIFFYYFAYVNTLSCFKSTSQSFLQYTSILSKNSSCFKSPSGHCRVRLWDKPSPALSHLHKSHRFSPDSLTLKGTVAKWPHHASFLPPQRAPKEHEHQAMKQPLTGAATLPPGAKGIADGKCSMDPREKSLWETPSSDFWTRAVEARMKKTVQDEDKHNKLRKSRHAFPRGMSCLTNLLKHSEGVSMDKRQYRALGFSQSFQLGLPTNALTGARLMYNKRL